jgi:hypothetical protein
VGGDVDRPSIFAVEGRKGVFVKLFVHISILLPVYFRA